MFAFARFEKIEEIVIETENLTSIPAHAFNGCQLLTDITWDISNLETIGNFAFYDCYSLSLDLPDTVTSIGNWAFKGVPVVNFPDGINESLTIPADKWGATKITIEGVEYGA